MAAAKVLAHWKGQLDGYPNAINDCRFWQYGNGKSALEPRKIVGVI